MAKILLVEDDNNLREIYGARLAAEGYDIISAPDGEEALALAVKEKPDLIITDVMMPKVSGFDMLDILRNAPETKNTKVIMMTALSQAEDKERADKLGADLYLVKSQVTLEDVTASVHKILDGQAPAQSDDTMPADAPGNPSSPTEPAVPQNTPEPVPVSSTGSAPSASPVAPTPPAVEEPSAPSADALPANNPAPEPPSQPVPEPAASQSAQPTPSSSEESDSASDSPPPAVPASPGQPSTPPTPAPVEPPKPPEPPQQQPATPPPPAAASAQPTTSPVVSDTPSTAPAVTPANDPQASEPDKSAVKKIEVILPDSSEEKPEEQTGSEKSKPAGTSPQAPSPAADPLPDASLSIGPNLTEALAEEEKNTQEPVPESRHVETSSEPPNPSTVVKPQSFASQAVQDQADVDNTPPKPAVPKSKGGEKVIEPLNDPAQKPDFEALLAKENAKNNALPASPTPPEQPDQPSNASVTPSSPESSEHPDDFSKISL